MRISTIVVGFFLLNNAYAQVAVQATLSKNRIFIGDRTQLNFEIRYAPNCEIDAILTDTLKQLGLECTVPKNENYWQTHAETPNGTLYKTKIFLQGFDADTLEIPALPILYLVNGQRDTVFTLPLTLTIFPIEPDSSGQLLPIKPILNEEKQWQDLYPYLISLLFLSVAIVLGVVYFRKRKMSQKLPVNRAIAAGTNFYKKLNELEQQKLPEKGKSNQFCSELSYILRYYLHERYQISALEKNTSSLLKDLEHQPEILPMLETWEYLLINTDAVKFGNAEPGELFYNNAIQNAKNLIANG